MSINVEILHNPERHRPPMPFVVDSFYRPEVMRLREEYQLDKVVAGAKDRYEGFLMLIDWANRTVPRGNPVNMSFDALTILEYAKKGYGFYCSHYARVLTQAAHALGYGAREASIDCKFTERSHHHAVCEVWVDGLDKWVYADAMHYVHYEKDGIGQNIHEIRDSWLSNSMEGLYRVNGAEHKTVVPSPELIATEGPYKGSVEPPNFYWFYIQMNNDIFSELSLHNEVHHRYLNFRDRHNAEDIWYQSSGGNTKVVHSGYWTRTFHDVWSPHQLYWPLNQAHIQWRESGPASLVLDIETICPNFSHFNISIDGGAPFKLSKGEPGIESPAPFWLKWDMKKGKNEIGVSAVNLFGVEGTPSRLRAVL